MVGTLLESVLEPEHSLGPGLGAMLTFLSLSSSLDSPVIGLHLLATQHSK